MSRWHRLLLLSIFTSLLALSQACPEPSRRVEGFAPALTIGVAPDPRPASVSSALWTKLARGDRASFLVVLAEQANLSDVPHTPQAVYDALREVALRSQASLRSKFDRAGVAYRPFYIVNMLEVEGDRALLTYLAARSEVARIEANPWVQLPRTQPPPNGGRSWVLPPVGGELARGTLLPSVRGGLEGGTVEWNVQRVNADDVWALGHTGQGVVVAGQDTGYDWDHPALITQYRGWNGITATHDYNWHDAIHTNTHGYNLCGVDSPEPCDDYGHGTHTLGTMVGDDGLGNQVGVAPGARWIGCRNMDNGWGTPATYAECFQFFLAPYPIGGDPFTDGVPDLAPHVINNSWTCPPSEGCAPNALQDVVENVRAAGILVVASAGNSGPGCGSVSDPPAIYDAAFSVGASDSRDTIASFSSRGPVTVDGSDRRKPDVTAPGVSVRSSLPGGGYGPNSGTSMAGPHAAGVAALVWSAAPYLIGEVDLTEQLIAQTAYPMTTTQSCGDDGPDDVPNNVYGWGIVDALAAVQQALQHLEVEKRASAPIVRLSSHLTYTVVLSAAGGQPVTPVWLTDTLPVSISFGGDLWASSGSWGQAAGGSGEPGGTVITWTGTVYTNTPVVITFTATISDTVADGEVVTNTAIVHTPASLLSSTAPVLVDALPPVSLISHPVTGQTVGGATCVIRGTAWDTTSGVAGVELSTDGGNTWVAAGDTSAWSYTWVLPLEEGVSHNLRTRAIDAAGHLEAPGNGVTVTVDAIAPRSSVSHPARGQAVTSTLFLITGTADDGWSGVGLIEVSTDGGNSWDAAGGGETWVYTWTVPSEWGVTHIIRSRATDGVGNVELPGPGVTVTVSNQPRLYLPLVMRDA